MPSPPSKHALPPRPAPLRRFMAAPLIVATLLMLATALLAVLAWMGGTASGDRVDLQLRGACAAEALPLVRARAEAVGLGDPELSLQDDMLVLTATLPGLDDDGTAIPRLLSRRGWLEVRRADTVVLDRAAVTQAAIRLDESGSPYVWVDLDKDAVAAFQAALDADPSGELTFYLDDEVAAVRPNSRGIKDDGLRIVHAGDAKPAVRMRIAADTSIALTHGPLPCALEAGVPTPVARAGSPE
ncbi:MAG: hypothetical protein VX265_01845 [Myxococcota bacterium]|nr:hypothetical protein [Myxococcota bacterium]MEC8424819.1 hypothetical protein [Myxococcota bacterium]